MPAEHEENLPGDRQQSGLKTPPPPAPPRLAEQERLRFSLSGDRTVRLIFGGTQPTQAEIDELMDYLKISRRTYPASLPTTPENEE